MTEATINLSIENHPTKIKRLLLVENEKEIASWLSENLKNSVEFYWARNLKDALSEIREKIPDVLILDLKLPDGNGAEVLKEMKNKNLPTTVYVFSVNSEMRNTCLRLGAKKFFDKSTESKKMIDELRSVL